MFKFILNMKTIILHLLRLAFIGILPISVSSQSYNWVNDQYDAGDWGDYGGILYHNSMEGAVKQVETFLNYEHDTLICRSSVMYDPDGRITEYINNGFRVIYFEYKELSDSVLVSMGYVSENDTSWTQSQSLIVGSILASPVPDSIWINNKGNVVMYAHNKDVTYSFYDNYGRKVLDSIPEGMSMGHIIQWEYANNKIYKQQSFSLGNIEKFEYLIDEYKNWTQLNSIRKDGSSSIVKQRKITYY